MSDKKILLGRTPLKNNLKDAIHTPVISCIAGGDVSRGSCVSVIDGKASLVHGADARCVGIVDPFRGETREGDLIWVLVKPDSITNVSHQWDFKSRLEKILDSIPTREEACDDYDDDARLADDVLIDDDLEGSNDDWCKKACGEV